MKENNTANKQYNSINNNEPLNIERENALLKQENEELRAKVKFFEEQLRLSAQQKYGSSKDAVSPDQMSFFNEAEKLSEQKVEEPNLEEITYKRKTGQSRSRKTYDDLPVEQIHYTLDEEGQVCPKCDHNMHEMKTEVRKELKVIPPQVKVVHHVKHVYACRNCDQNGIDATIITAPSPNPVLPGSMVSPSLIAFIMDQKYSQALPLYRQEEAFKNFGIDIPRQNMAHWIIQCSLVWLAIIFTVMHQELLKETVVHADESPLNVYEKKKGQKGYMWLYASAKASEKPMLLYEYQPGRSKEYPKAFLRGFKGYLQTDGYAAYNSVITARRIGCFAHARRHFTDAIKALPKEAQHTSSKSHEGLHFFTKIYTLEKKWVDLSIEERFEKRQEELKPLLDEFKLWLEEEKLKTLPKSLLGKAIQYTLNQWPFLIGVLEDGSIAIDNNLAERGIKPFVIGRKNYLFCQSVKGAKASAIAYSVVQTAKANGLIPVKYLEYLFEKLPNVDTNNPEVLDALLPWSKSLPPEIRQSDDKKQTEDV